LVGSGRLGNLEDRSVGTEYADDDRDFGVRVTVSRYADPTWVLHEFTGGLCKGSDLAGTPSSRYFQSFSVGHAGVGGHVTWAHDESTLILVSLALSGAGDT
jgi:hypothetical protein